MIRCFKVASFLGLGLFFISPVSSALDLVGGHEVDIYTDIKVYDYGTNIDDTQAGAIWFDHLGVTDDLLYRSNLENAEFGDTEYLNIDLKHKVFSLTDKAYLALGLGWRDVNVNNDNINGTQILVEGRVGLGGAVYLYGQTAWFPELNDFANHSDVDGTEFEAGLGFSPLPFLSFTAGYRKIKIDYTNDLIDKDESANSAGFTIGAGFHW